MLGSSFFSSVASIFFLVATGIFFCGVIYLSALSNIQLLFSIFILLILCISFVWENRGFFSMREGDRSFIMSFFIGCLVFGFYICFLLDFEVSLLINNTNSQEEIAMVSFFNYFSDGLPLIGVLFIFMLLLVVFNGSIKEVSPLSSVQLYLVLLAYLMLLGLVQSNDFMYIYGSVEIASMLFYGIISSSLKTQAGAEAVMKYFLMSGFAGILLGFGFLVNYSAYGIMQFVFIPSNVWASTLSLTFIVIALLVKLGGVPFHGWVLDVYKVAPIFIIIFLLTIPKIVYVYIIFYALLTNPFAAYVLSPVFIMLGFVGIMLSSIQMFNVLDFKTFYAYSTLNMIGFVFYLLGVGLISTFTSVLLIIISYVITSLGLLLCISIVSKYNVPFFKRKGSMDLFLVSPAIGFIIFIFIFSNAGLPPLFGFFAKLYGAFSMSIHVMDSGVHVGALLFYVFTIIFTMFSYFIFVSKMQYGKLNNNRWWYKIQEVDLDFLTVLFLIVCFYSMIAGDVFNLLESLDFFTGIKEV